ncbi:dihydrolipoyllysine-residue acetyltransferase [Parahaliea sp. F7430]|uniref:Acetyltransferase component of pyruvate dehydrogenase complex n=1 Tax=Sediminihaliea albiluteola TaxID=2758564 RepID=A0A7W2YKZ3_9GAMM|nr:dihydrolipoyllysine-residue acetyltransferase [Sediminihaliea albiluteola]MBA6414244.1 dihydrolipoyllysine-residue acetyltransferase [Sediminihaliea albiluteola]
MAKQEVIVPDIGGAEGAEVIELLVAVGDTVEVEQGLIVLESDKASMEIPSSHSGTVLEMRVAEGDELAEGATILVLEVEADSSSAEEEPSEQGGAAEEEAPSETSAAAEPSADADAAEEAPASSSGESVETIVPVPDIGTDDAVDLIEISVAVGDQVAEGDSLVVLESDKASMEVPSPSAGEVLEILVKEGDSVSQGDPLLKMKVSAAAEAKPESQESPEPAAATEPAERAASAAAAKASAPAPAKASASASADSSSAAANTGGSVYAGPAVRKMARELGVDMQRIKATGPRGRILKEDLQSYVKDALTAKQAGVAGAGIPPIPEVDFSAFGEVEVLPRSKLDKLTANNMQRNWLNVPHVTQFDEADITELEAFRNSLKAEAEQRGTKLTPLPFLLKACAIALRDNPKFNASLSADGEDLVYKKYTHIGMAVETPAGLMVPVIRDVDQKTLWQLAEEVLELAGKARDRKLKPAEMQGGCFTISSLGGIGGTGFTPIVSAPEVGILGVSRAQVKPQWDGEQFQPRTMLPVSLSYDHRVINGGDAGRFCSQLVSLLGDIRKLLL